MNTKQVHEVKIKKHKRNLNKAPRKQMIIRALAEDNWTHAEIARKWGVHRSAITQFKARWLPEVEQAKKEVEEQFHSFYLAGYMQRVLDDLR